MSASNSNSPFNDPNYSRERLELETRVLAAALRQSLEIGDTEGSSLAHEQIFLLLKASQEMVIDEPLNLPREVLIDRGRQLPDIDWGSSEEKAPEEADQLNKVQQVQQTEPARPTQQAEQLHQGDFAPPLAADGQIQGVAPALAEAEAMSGSAEAKSTSTGALGAPAKGLTEAAVEGLAEGSALELGEGSGQGLVHESTQDLVRGPVELSVEGSVEGSVEEAGGEMIAGPFTEASATVETGPSTQLQAQLAGSEQSASPAPEGEARDEVENGPTVVSGESTAAATVDVASAVPGLDLSPQIQGASEDQPQSQATSATGLQPQLQPVSGRGPEATPEATSEEGEGDYYSRLKVTDLADFASIHLAFWRIMRPLLRQEIGLMGPDRLQHLRRLQRLWIAHDILTDPVTRADYDFRRMGVRGGEEQQGSRHHVRGSGQRTQLRIGELLQCAGLLEQNELDIAADMHKAMPEILFGTFLVKQGFVEEADLDCVLVGQQLLKTGEITVVQFQTVMIERSATGLDIGEMLLAKGYVTQAMLERAYRNQSEDTLVKVPIVLGPGQKMMIEAKPPTLHEDVEKEEPPSAEAQSASADLQELSARAEPTVAAESSPSDANQRSDRSFNLANAAPAWKDQLDWSSPESVGSTAENQPSNAEPREAGLNEVEIDLVRSRWSAPDVVLPEKAELASDQAPELVLPGMNDAVAESVRAIAQIWADQPEPVSIWAREQPAGEGPLKVAASVQEGIESAEVVLDNQAGQAVRPKSGAEVPIETFANSPAVSADSATFGVQTGQDLAENPFVLQEGGQTANSSGLDPASGPASGPANYSLTGTATDPSLTRVNESETISEIETSGQLPSLGVLEMQARDKEEQRQVQAKKATGDWQIMSVPHSTLASLFLDEEPEAQTKDPTMANEITGSMNAFVDDSPEDQYQTGPRKAQENQPPGDPDSPPGSGPKKPRRRRTRH